VKDRVLYEREHAKASLEAVKTNAEASAHVTIDNEGLDIGFKAGARASTFEIKGQASNDSMGVDGAIKGPHAFADASAGLRISKKGAEAEIEAGVGAYTVEGEGGFALTSSPTFFGWGTYLRCEGRANAGWGADIGATASVTSTDIGIGGNFGLSFGSGASGRCKVGIYSE